MSRQTVIVTGASRGLGAAIAVQVAELGAAVILNGRSRRALDAVAARIAAMDVPVEAVAGDLRDEHVCRKIVAVAEKQFGRIDALINNAGVLQPLARIDDMDVVQWEAHWETNLLVPVYLTSLCLPELRRCKGRVVNITSGAATGAHAGWGAYCCSKAALNMFTSVLALEEPDLTAIAVRPGLVDTDMQETVRTHGGGVMNESDHRRFLQAHEQGELVPPDVAGRAVGAVALFAPAAWSGSALPIDDERIADLVARKRRSA